MPFDDSDVDFQDMRYNFLTGLSRQQVLELLKLIETSTARGGPCFTHSRDVCELEQCLEFFGASPQIRDLFISLVSEEVRMDGETERFLFQGDLEDFLLQLIAEYQTYVSEHSFPAFLTQEEINSFEQKCCEDEDRFMINSVSLAGQQSYYFG